MSGGIGGTQSVMQGGSFRDGFTFSAITSSFAIGYEKVVGRVADAAPGENRPGQTK